MRMLAAIALLFACGGDAGSSAAIPHTSTAERLGVAGMDYAPEDAPLGWTAAGELVVAHLEVYRAADVYSSVCTGSGFYALDLATGRLRALREGGDACTAVQRPHEAALLPDASGAIYSSQSPPNNSYLRRLDFATGRSDSLAAECNVYLERPAASRAGLMAFGLCNRRQPEYGLYRMELDGAGLRRVGAARALYSTASWGPGGSLLATRSDAATGPRLVMISPDGDEERTVGLGSSGVWSADGNWIAFLERGRSRDAVQVAVMRADGSDRRVIFSNSLRSTLTWGFAPRREGVPAGPLVWSPDGRSVAFTRTYDGGILVWMAPVNGGAARQLTRPAH
jgi:Tol biopolymer transport system component